MNVIVQHLHPGKWHRFRKTLGNDDDILVACGDGKCFLMIPSSTDPESVMHIYPGVALPQFEGFRE